MKHENNPSGRVQPGARPNQHISSIAHLFFDNTVDDDQSTHAVVHKEFLVVGAGRDTSAPYTAVGLGQHLLDQSATVGERGNTESTVPIRQVFFAEPSPVRFSGISHLQKGSFRPPAGGESVPWPLRQGVTAPVLRLFPGQAPSEDVSGGMVEGCYYIRHLDLPREAELNALETQQAAGHLTGFGEGSTETLLWCVQDSVAVSLVLIGRLGRLLRICQPKSIHVLVYPERARRQRMHPPETTRALLQRSSRLVQYVAGGTTVESLLMGETPEEQGLQLAALSRQLSL